MNNRLVRYALLLIMALSLAGCGGGGGNSGGSVTPTPNNPGPQNPDPVEPDPVEPDPGPLTLNEQHRHDAGLSKVAPNGTFPSNHRDLVKPKFAVLEVSSDRGHGRSIQAAACAGYAPDPNACTIERDSGLEGNPWEAYSVSNTPFTYIFQPGQTSDVEKSLQQHPDLVIASLSVLSRPRGYTKTINDAGIVVVSSAGNNGTTDYRVENYQFWSRSEVPLQPGEDPNDDRFPEEGASLMQQIANNNRLLVAGYDKDGNGNFVPHRSTTQCQGVDAGCLYAPFDFRSAGYLNSGTSLSGPFVAAGLASVLAVFPETSGQDLIRLAKACAVREPGLTNGLGRFSLACMNNSDTFPEETVETISVRNTGMAQAFANTSLPGSTSFTYQVEGVPLVRAMEGSFKHSVGLIPTFSVTEEEQLALFSDSAYHTPGIRFGTEKLFFATSLAQGVPHFMGAPGYTTESINVATGTRDAFIRFSRQEGSHNGGGVVEDVAGTGLGLTLRHAFTTHAGELEPFIHLDRFMGGSADTTHGTTLNLKESAWNREVGIAFTTSFQKQELLSFVVSSFTDGATQEAEQQARLQYRLLF